MSRYGIFKFAKESFALSSVSHSMESIGPETTEVVNPIDNEVGTKKEMQLLPI